MKTALIAAVMLTLSAAGVAAKEIPTPAARQVYTCEGRGLSRVAMRVDPAPCCEGMLGCPQLLGSTGLIRPHRSNRT